MIMLNNNLQKSLIIRVCDIFSITLILSLACNAYSGQPKLTKSRLSELLQQPTVSAIHRDRDGVLWIGTQQGLHRYDGANFTVFNSDSGNKNRIPDSEIKSILEDTDGNLFVATASGTLLKWDSKIATFESIISSGLIGDSKLVQLLLSQQGSIWLLSRNRLSLYDPRSKSVAGWLKDIELVEIIGTPRDIVEDASGNVWVAGDSGIIRLQIEKRTLVLVDLAALNLPSKSKVTTLEPLQNDKLIIGTDIGYVLAWDINSNAPFAIAKLGGDSRTYVSQFLQYEDQLIIGTDRGLYRSDRNLSYFENLEDNGAGLSNPNVYSLFKDGKYVWIGTIDGLDILSFAPFELFNSRNSGIPNDILTFEEDDEGRLWVGTYDGLYRYDKNTQTHVKFEARENSARLDQPVATIAARKSNLWIGLIRGGVHIIDTISGQQKARNLTNNDSSVITNIIDTIEGEDLLIATYDHGLFRITHDNTKSYYEERSLPEKSITALFQSKAGVLIAVSGNKVFLHNPQTDKYRKIPLEFDLMDTTPLIYSFGQTASGDILIGTKDHGLFLWSRQSQLSSSMNAQSFGERGDLKYSTIYGIEVDLVGGVWCSTENGIVKLDPTGLLIKRFTIADGLQGSDFTLGASFTSKEGLIYFGGMNGYNRFDPSEIDIDTSTSPMRLTGINLPAQDRRNLVELTELKSLQLTHNDYFVTFQFSVLDFIDAEKNQFRYMLENFDDEWIENGTRNTATYTNLPAGDYVFRVQGANSAGIWNRDGLTLDVDVLPAPWYSWWAYSMYSAGLMCLIWGLLRIYRSYAIDRKSAQMAQEMFDAENRADDEMQEQLELQDEMVMSSYQHNLTTLSLVSEFITSRSVSLPENVKRKLSESSVRRISALSSLEDCLSYQAGAPVVDLKKHTDGIFTDLLADAPVNPATIVTINEVTSMLLPAELASPISIIMYELLENCVQHAFEQDSPANYIRVRLATGTSDDGSANLLNLAVGDSGIGFPEKVEELAIDGSGIAIVVSIVKKLGGSLEFSGKQGTLVTMSIPYDA